MKAKYLLAVGVTLLAGSLTACTPDISAGSYTTNQVGAASETQSGTIINATPVKVSGSRTEGVGTLVGALAGGVAGSAIGGSGRANALGAIGGAVLGGAAGNMAEGHMTKQTGMQYSVRLSNKRIVTVTQGMEPVLAVGQRVLVIFSNPARVIPQG